MDEIFQKRIFLLDFRSQKLASVPKLFCTSKRWAGIGYQFEIKISFGILGETSGKLAQKSAKTRELITDYRIDYSNFYVPQSDTKRNIQEVIVKNLFQHYPANSPELNLAENTVIPYALRRDGIVWTGHWEDKAAIVQKAIDVV